MRNVNRFVWSGHMGILELLRVWSGCCTGVARVTLSEAERAERALDAHRCACPTLALMYREGLLNPAEDGRVSWKEVNAGLRRIGFCRTSAFFQTTRAAWLPAEPEPSFLNIFAMSPGDDEAGESANDQLHLARLQHGLSSVIRDSRFDGATDADAVRAVRKARFDEVYGEAFTEVAGERRCYLDGLARVIGHLKVHGDKAGEWSSENVRKYHPKAATREDGAFLDEMTEVRELSAQPLLVTRPQPKIPAPARSGSP